MQQIFSEKPPLGKISDGKGGGTVTQCRYVKSVKGSFSNLLMGVSARMGCPVEKFGDGTKMLPDLV